MKKLIAIVLALILLVSCGKATSEEPTETGQVDAQISVETDSTETTDEVIVFIEPATPVLSSTKYVSLSLEDA